jgi:hypothetical protein
LDCKWEPAIQTPSSTYETLRDKASSVRGRDELISSAGLVRLVIILAAHASVCRSHSTQPLSISQLGTEQLEIYVSVPDPDSETSVAMLVSGSWLARSLKHEPSLQ